MCAWISKFKDALSGGGGEAVEEVRRQLRAAQRARANLHLEPRSAGVDLDSPLLATIEQVRSDDFIISQPLSGVTNHPLAKGEQLTISFALDSKGRLCATTRSLGRVKIPSGGSGMIYGYKLVLPEALTIDERRAHNRIAVAFDLAPQAELFTALPSEAITGAIVNLSSGGALVRLAQGCAAKLDIGQRLLLNVTLPVPVGEVNESVIIARIHPGAERNSDLIGIGFEQKIEGLVELLSLLERRRALRGAA